MKKSILVTDNVHPKLISELESDNFKIDYYPKLPLEETHNLIHTYTGLIVNSKTICDKSLIDKGEKLQFIGRLGSGLEIIDVDYASLKGITVIRTPEANCDAVAEHALGMILSLFNNLFLSRSQLKNLNWQREQNRGQEIRGRTVGIIGYGYTGRAFSHVLGSLGATILCHDKYKYGFQYESTLQEIQSQANIISLHLPLTDEAIHYLNKNFIDNCKKPFYLINTARGKNVNTHDLIKALDNNKIRGACLDVFENEKPDSYTTKEKEMYGDLMSRKNVVCTPHVAGWTYESLERIADTMVRKIRAIGNLN